MQRQRRNVGSREGFISFLFCHLLLVLLHGGRKSIFLFTNFREVVPTGRREGKCNKGKSGDLVVEKYGGECKVVVCFLQNL